jgi:two-component system chemotaxis response regulator CheY
MFMQILVVDDEADVQPLFIQRFRKEIRDGLFDFVFARSGQEALDLLAESHPTFALILSDINMPGMSGIEMLSRIRHTYKNPPPIVMMISAYGDDENRAHAEHSGASDFLTKPVDFVGLKEKLTALIVG